MLARSCEGSSERAVTIVVDPRPLGVSVRAIRIDVFDHEGARGSIERNYAAGESPDPVRLRTASLGRGAEVVIEVEGASGIERVHRPLDAPAGSTVTILLGDVTR